MNKDINKSEVSSIKYTDETFNENKEKENPVSKSIVTNETGINKSAEFYKSCLKIKCNDLTTTADKKFLKLNEKIGVVRKTPLTFAGVFNLFYFKDRNSENPFKCSKCGGGVSKEKMGNRYVIRCQKKGCGKYLFFDAFKAYLTYLYFRGIVSITGDNDTNYEIQFKNLETNKIEKKFKFFNKFETPLQNTPIIPNINNKSKTLYQLKDTLKCIYDIPGYGIRIEKEEQVTVNDLYFEKIILQPKVRNKKRKIDMSDDVSNSNSVVENENNSNNL